jgi:predicted enzyme related to lactoylglutathione lyase
MRVRVGVGGVLATVLILAFGARSPVAADGPAGSALYGKFVWNDLLTKDLPAARTFYASMFGWTFREQTRDGRPYLIAELDGNPVAGLLDVHDLKDADPQWVSFVSVPDVDAAVKQVTDAGGKVLVAARAVKVGGRAAVVADPQGAPLGVARLTGGDPTDPAQPVIGRFFWAEYLAKDGAQAVEFYKKLLGYEATETDSTPGIHYYLLKRDRLRAGLFQLPDSVTGVRPNWLPYVRVEDPAAAADKAKSLGGKVVLQPSPERRKGTLAIVTDPGGAALALQKLPIS